MNRLIQLNRKIPSIFFKSFKYSIPKCSVNFMFMQNQEILHRNYGTLVDSSETFKHNFETWCNILVSKYSTPFESVNESTNFETDEIEGRLQLIFPIILHNPEINPQTLLDLFNLYEDNYELFISNTFEYTDVFKALFDKFLMTLQLMDIDQLLELSKILQKMSDENDKSFYLRTFIKDIVSEIFLRCMLKTTLSEALDLYCVAYSVLGRDLFISNSFLEIVSNFEDDLNSISIQQALRIYMFISLRSRKNIAKTDFESEIIDSVKNIFENNISLLSFDELADVLFASFNLQSKFGLYNQDFNNNLITKVKNWLASHSEEVTHTNLFSFLTILKALRYRQCYDLELLHMLKDMLLKEDFINLVPPVNIPDILSFFSLCRFYDEELFRKSEQWVLLNVLKDNFKVKDIARILWAYSYIDFNCNEVLLNEIILKIKDIPQIEASFTNEENHENIYAQRKYKKQSFNYIKNMADICMSLSQVGYYQKFLIEKVFNYNLNEFQGKYNGC